MYRLPIKYYKYLFILLIIYLSLLLVKNILNLYTILIVIIFLIVFYNKNHKLFKKIAYKLIFKRKGNFSFKNKYGAAKTSLDAIDEFSKKISNKVDAELLKYEKKVCC